MRLDKDKREREGEKEKRIISGLRQKIRFQ